MKEKDKIITLKNIYTKYQGDKIPVIKNINFDVKYGEFISIIGSNGSGKTTLIETINGLLTYYNGVGLVFNKEINKYKYEIRKNIGYVIQNFDIDSNAPFLCKDVVMSGKSGKIGSFRNYNKRDWEDVWYSMGLVGMIDFANRPIGKLSGGEFQKIMISRALAQNPDLLLLDEPLSNLDYNSRNQIEILLNRLNQKNKITIIMVSHDLSFIPSDCKRIIVMDKGEIIMDGNKKEILSSEFIKRSLKNKKESI
jgi:zinc/manganese transport system ATP-binding protein